MCHSNPAYPSQSLIKAICYPEAEKFTNAATVWGCTHEKVARDKYCLQASRNHTNFTINDSGLIINPSYPHLGATPDGKISCECCGTGCLEIKCPYCGVMTKTGYA